MQTFQFNTIEEALEDFRQGKMVIVVDDGDAENDGALAVAGQFATPEAVNFMLSHGRGLMTMPISEEIAGKIGVAELIWENRELSRSTATVTIDSVHVSVGVSAGRPFADGDGGGRRGGFAGWLPPAGQHRAEGGAAGRRVKAHRIYGGHRGSGRDGRAASGGTALRYPR